MKGIVLNRQLESKTEFVSLPDPGLTSGEALIRIKAAALNHRDEWCRQGLYPNLSDGVVLGSDGAGVVEKVADERDSFWVGKEVIINPAIRKTKRTNFSRPLKEIFRATHFGVLRFYFCFRN